MCHSSPRHRDTLYVFLFFFNVNYNDLFEPPHCFPISDCISKSPCSCFSYEGSSKCTLYTKWECVVRCFVTDALARVQFCEEMGLECVVLLAGSLSRRRSVMRRLNCDMLGESSGKGISLFPCFYRVVCRKQSFCAHNSGIW